MRNITGIGWDIMQMFKSPPVSIEIDKTHSGWGLE
jgi:hypothetical protein